MEFYIFGVPIKLHNQILLSDGTVYHFFITKIFTVTEI